MLMIIPVIVVLIALFIVYGTITGKTNNIFDHTINTIFAIFGFIAELLGKVLYTVPFFLGVACAVYVIPNVSKYGFFVTISTILCVSVIPLYIYSHGLAIMSVGVIISLIPFTTNFIFGSVLMSGNSVQIDLFWNIIVSTIVISFGIIIAQIGKVQHSKWGFNW
jgi:hypothetical protein